jgi:hypothetical protein
LLLLDCSQRLITPSIVPRLTDTYVIHKRMELPELFRS